MIRKHAQPVWMGTNAERLSFSPPADSPVKTFFETDTMEYYWWDGTQWVEFGAGSGGGHVIQDDGVDLTQRTNLNITGDVLEVSDDAGNDATVLYMPDRYVDKTGDVMTGMLYLPDIQFDISHSLLDYDAEGKLHWNSEDGTLEFGMGGEGGVVQQIGQETYFYVKNQTGDILENGKVIAAVGAIGASGRISADYGIADGSMEARYILGVSTEDIADGEDGYVTEFGLVRHIDTTGTPYGEVWAAGDVLFVSPTIPGGFTNVEPSAPNLKIPIAMVLLAHGSTGSIFVRATHGLRFQDLHDYSAYLPSADGDLITWNADGYYESQYNILDYMSELDISTWRRYGIVTGYFVQSQVSLNVTNPSLNNYVFNLVTDSTEFKYWRQGVMFTIPGNTHSVALPGSPPPTASYFIYIDNDEGTLEISTDAWTLLDNKVPVAIVTFNDTLTPKYMIAYECHSPLIDRRMHYYLHLTEGTRYIGGGALTGYSIDTDSNAAHTFAVSSGTIADEDIVLTTGPIADPNGTTDAYTLLYRSGASTWVWRRSDQPFPYTTTGYVEYDNGGTLTPGTGGAGANTRWINSYVVLTNWLDPYSIFPTDTLYNVVIIPGQNIYTSLDNALAEDPSVFTWTGIPIKEFVILWRCTWALRGGTSKGKCELDVIPTTVRVSAAATTFPGAVQHNSLSGIQGGAAGEYYHITAAQHADIVAGIPTVLDDLDDVIIYLPQADEILKYNGSEWVNDTGGGGASALDDLTDVEIDTPVAGNLLAFDETDSLWKNVNFAFVGGSIENLVDVDFPSDPSVNDVLIFQDLGLGDYQWTNVPIGDVSSQALADLTDVNLYMPAADDYLIFDGADWINSPILAHASTHQDGGADGIATETAAAGAIPKAGTDGLLGIDWLPVIGSNIILLDAPLTSTSWDGDAYSTTAKTLIDLSSVFGVPAGVKAVLVRVYARDSASSGTTTWIGLSPNNTADSVTSALRLVGITNDYVHETQMLVPCNADGDIYYQTVASGANTLDIWMQIWGYWLGDNTGVPDLNFVPLDAALTSTSWDGDSYSTVASGSRVKIDLSTVFGVPPGIKAVLARVIVRDSGSAASTTCEFSLCSTATGNMAQLSVRCAGKLNDAWAEGLAIVPCTDGDIWYYLTASGASTTDVYIQIMGYWLDTSSQSPTENLVMLDGILTSTSFDGDTFSTTAKTLVDSSVAFPGVPDGVRAIIARVAIKDSGSAASSNYYILFGSTNANLVGVYVRCGGLPNNFYADAEVTIPCDENGDFYYQIAASGVGTMAVYIQITGYVLPFSLNLPDVITDAGDIIIGQAGGTPARLPYGSYGQVLNADGVYPAWGYRIQNDGWVQTDATWTYISATSMQAGGNLLSILQAGDKIKISQTTDKYFYITGLTYAAPYTTINVTGGSDYSVANAAISTVWYSKVSCPQGFPAMFNYIPTFTGFSANPTYTARFSITNKVVYLHIQMTADGTSNATTFTITAPVVNGSVNSGALAPYAIDNSVAITTGTKVGLPAGSSTIQCYTNLALGVTWTASGGKRMSFILTYEMI